MLHFTAAKEKKSCGFMFETVRTQLLRQGN
jgi:hypothetical protein